MLKNCNLKKTISQITYQWMDSSLNLVNYNSRNSIVPNDSQNSLILHCSKFTLWSLPCRALSTTCIPITGSGRKSCKKSIMKGIKSTFRIGFSPFLIPLCSEQWEGKKEKENTCISKKTIKVYPHLDNPRRYKFYTGHGTTHFHSGGSHTYFYVQNKPIQLETLWRYCGDIVKVKG